LTQKLSNSWPKADPGWPLAGRRLAAGWPPAGPWLASGWPPAGLRLALAGSFFTEKAFP